MTNSKNSIKEIQQIIDENTDPTLEENLIISGDLNARTVTKQRQQTKRKSKEKQLTVKEKAGCAEKYEQLKTHYGTKI